MRERNVVLKGSMVVGSTLDYLGRPHEVVAAFAARVPAVIPTFCHDFLRFNKTSAQEAIEYAKGGMDYVDPYYEARRNGLSDREYKEWVAEMRIPITKGQYVMEWEPSKVEITAEIEMLLKGIDPLAAMRMSEKYATLKDSLNGRWLMLCLPRRK